MRVNDAVIGLVLLALAAFIGSQALTFPAMPGQSYGPSLLPAIIAAGLFITGAILIATGLRSGDVAGLVRLEPSLRRPGRWADALLVVGGLALLLAFWNMVGFLIGGTLYMTALVSRFRGGRVISSLAVCALLCLLLDAGFRLVLLVPLPQGPTTGLLW